MESYQLLKNSAFQDSSGCTDKLSKLEFLLRRQRDERSTPEFAGVARLVISFGRVIHQLGHLIVVINSVAVGTVVVAESYRIRF